MHCSIKPGPPRQPASTSSKLEAIRNKRNISKSKAPQSTAAKLNAIRQNRAQLPYSEQQEEVTPEPHKPGIRLPSERVHPSTLPADAIASKLATLSLSRAQGTDPGPNLGKEPEYYDSSRYFSSKLAAIQPPTLLSMFDSLTQSLFKNVPHSASGASLAISQLTEEASLLRARGSAGLTERDNILLRDMPTDIRTVYNIFDLDPEVTTFAACTRRKCCATFAPTIDIPSGIRRYPLRCTLEKFGSVCGSTLVKDGVVDGLSVPKPLRPFAYHHFNDHVASMLSQPGIEEAIRRHLHSGALERELRDIISSPELAEFKDPNGMPFLREDGTEIRLVWALCVDWYNPYSNKAAGKSASSGVISLICLSLPPELRTQEGFNYYAGGIPGPQESSVDATNQFLKPVIFDLQVAYDPGTYFSQTNDYPTGRVARSAIIPVIADTMASKKVTGHSGHRGKFFCSRCRLPRFEIDNLNMETWPPGLTRCQHQELAEEWLKAPTKTTQDFLLKANGIRWSVLLNLKYWKPTQWTIPEGVHIILLGLFPRHSRELLGLNLKDLRDEDEEVSPKVMVQARRALGRKSKTALKPFPMTVLNSLCVENGILVPPPAKGRRKKKEYIAALLGFTTLDQETDYNIASLFEQETDTLHYPVNNPDPRSSSVPSPPVVAASPASFITKQVLEQIRQDIAETLRPSWQAALPTNFGCAEHGKLKADQWRTAMEFDIPVSLVKILTNRKSSTITEDKRAHRIVEHTLDLAMAAAWALSRRTSAYHAERYHFYLRRYLTGIHELYPDFNLKPNHHYALHLVDILLGFGPLHGTWAFPLERLIGRVQGLNSNWKIGEMEITVMTTFCRRSRLLCLLSSKHCPAILKKAWVMLQQRLDLHDLDLAPSPATVLPPGVKARGSSYGDLETSVHQAFITKLTKPTGLKPVIFPEVLFHHQHDQSGVSYTDFHTSLAHSLIYFHPDIDDKSNLTPAQIRAIFAHKRRENGELMHEVFFAVHEFTRTDSNPFVGFPDFRAAIFHRQPSDCVQVIRATQVHCHANQRPWDDGTVVMRPINRNY